MATKNQEKRRKSRGAQFAARNPERINLGSLNRRTCLAWTSAVFLLHGLGLALLFTPVQGIVTSQPLIDQDWGLHFHHLRSMETFWRQDRAIWGYNPFFMAGYPSNTIQDLSIKFFEFFAVGLSSLALSSIQWFKIGAFLSVASIPWLLYFAAHNFFFASEAKNSLPLIASVLGTVYWWNSLPREMFFYGMIGFPFASYLCVWGMSLFFRLAMQSPQPGRIHVGWLTFAVAIPSLHFQSAATFLPPIIVLLTIRPRLLSSGLLAWIATAAAFALVVNAAWLIPAFHHRNDDVSSAIVNQLPLFASTDPFTFLGDYIGTRGYWTFRPSFTEKGFRLLLVILGTLGTWRLLCSEKRDLGIVLATALIVLFLAAYFGALIPSMKAWQPLRFKVPYDLFLIIGASFVIAQNLGLDTAARSRLVPALVCCGGIAFLINLVQTESTGKLQLRTQMNSEVDGVINWIKQQTPTDGRVLFEESGDETGFVYDGVYLSSFLPHLTGRQLIGGPINLYNDRHHFAEFHSAKLFGKNIQTLADEELRDYLRLYNVGAIVTFHPASIQRLQSIPGLVTVEQRIGAIHLMKVNQPLTWFIAGEGKINAGLNRLELTDLKGKEIVLKYHWVSGLNATPAADLVAVKMANDPIPFIKITNPPPSLVLRVGP